MNDILKEKMDVIGKYCLLNKSSYILKLHDLMDNKYGTNAILSKNGFLDIFSNIYIKLLYIDGCTLDFICGNKIVKMEFNSIVFKNINLSPETGEYFKVELDSDKRIKNTIYLSSLLTGESFVTIDFKQLNSMLISDNDYSQNIDDDIYYGGLFKIREELNKEAKVEEDTFIPLVKQEENKSYFNSPVSNKNVDEKNSLLDNVKNEEDKNENNVTEEKILNISDNYNVTVSKFDLRRYEETKVHSEAMSDNILKKCVNLINQSYDTTVNHITFGILVYIDKYDWKERIASDLVFTMCILKDENSTFLIVTTYKGDIKMSIEIISDPYKKYIEICRSIVPLKNVFIHKPYQG